MEFMLDTANLASIARMLDIYPISGLTCNPTILSKEGHVNFFDHVREMRQLAGADRTLHVQVVSTDCDGMLADAHAILDRGDADAFIKIPVTEEGMRAIRMLKEQHIGVTATAVYSRMQGMLAIAAGADYIAPYCNRMAETDVDFLQIIRDLRHIIDENGSKTKIIAASFRNKAQITGALLAGAHAATVSPAFLSAAVETVLVKQTVEDFSASWSSIFGSDTPAVLAAQK